MEKKSEYKYLAEFNCDKCGSKISINLDEDEKCPFCEKEYNQRYRFVGKCSICGGFAVQDHYGNGECNNCGWKFSKDEDDFEKEYHISYPMLVPPSRAREQYKQGKPFKASFEDFVNGLYFYSEMLFDYKSEIFEVFFKPGYIIVLCSKNMQHEYKTRNDFEEKANINGKLLKDIWNEVINPRFMSCG